MRLLRKQEISSVAILVHLRQEVEKVAEKVAEKAETNYL